MKIKERHHICAECGKDMTMGSIFYEGDVKLYVCPPCTIPYMDKIK
ncbi:hypothetical protein LCGC14_2449510 [marine sediment metagenome]|uniref:LIM zinc-binding domain-containing protein n=1 Tax=marine sediment metagenome TaxID=412755 RepID=A0A0F9C453_9ZZZZ